MLKSISQIILVTSMIGVLSLFVVYILYILFNILLRIFSRNKKILDIKNNIDGPLFRSFFYSSLILFVVLELIAFIGVIV